MMTSSPSKSAGKGILPENFKPPGQRRSYGKTISAFGEVATISVWADAIETYLKEYCNLNEPVGYGRLSKALKSHVKTHPEDSEEDAMIAAILLFKSYGERVKKRMGEHYVVPNTRSR